MGRSPVFLTVILTEFLSVLKTMGSEANTMPPTGANGWVAGGVEAELLVSMAIGNIKLFDRLVDADQSAAVREDGFYLDEGDHVRHSFHDICLGQC